MKTAHSDLLLVTEVPSLPVADVTVVSDVPVFWLDAPGPTRAGLVFRAGWVDEDLRHRGATHLVEHLSLVASLGQQAFDFNAMVDETTTTFACSGTRDQAITFLHAVCAGLSTLPIDRLEAEKRILQVEASTRTRSTVDVLRRWRFGAAGPGRGSYDEFALQWLTPDAAVTWAQRAFAAGNAAAWITCPPPEELEFTLPVGGRMSLPPAVSMVTDGPSHVVASASGGLAASLLVPRASDGAAIEWLLQRRLFERLRLRDAVSYSVDVQRRPADSAANELFVFVDGLPGAQAELERGVLDVMDLLASAPCQDEELTQWRERFASSMAESDATPGLLHQMARDYLYERPAKQAENLIHEASLVTPASVRQTLADSLRSCVYCVPDATGVIATETNPMPHWSTSTVAGQRFKPTDPNSAALMMVGADGVSHVVDAERRVTVTWKECAAVLRWDDGGRRVFGADGIVIDLPPHAWHHFSTLRDAVDEWTPYNVVVDMGEAPPRPAAPLPRSRVLGGADTGVVVVLAVALVLCGLMLTMAGARPFLLGGIPSFALAAPCVREVYLRKKGRRASGKGPTPRLSRPLRHIPRQRLLVILGLALAFTAATGLAAAGGANVGPLPFLFGFVGLTAVRELFRRPARGPRAR